MKRKARIDLAVYTRQMRRQSIWCGTVLALAVVFTALNVLPPVGVYYEISGKVLLGPNRVNGLVSNLKSSTDISQSVRLRDFQVLDRSDLSLGALSPSSEGRGDSVAMEMNTVVLLNIQSLWSNRGSSQEFHSWIESITRPAVPEMQESELSKSLRMARWELSAARHYAAHHDFLVDVVDQQVEGSDSSTEAFRLVSSERPGKSGTDVLSVVSENEVAVVDSAFSKEQLALNKKVEQAQTKLGELEQQLSEAMARSLGTVQITDSLRVRPLAQKIPFWMALSVIVLGIAAGTSAGWFQWRLQSGGIYDPMEVASQLSSRGLPVVSRVNLPTDQLDSADWLEIASQQASGASRRTARHFTMLAELALAFWLFLLVIRLVIDPAWRWMLLDSPLAAFGRLLTGLP